jgi:serine/threonine-protein kinase
MASSDDVSEPPTVEDGAAAAAASASLPAARSGRYAITDELGRGGMGEVFLAVDHQMNREVAIKRMRAKDPSDRAIARFMREARVQGRLEHPAIPPVHELGRDPSGRPYFAMKRLQGRTLASILASGDATRERLLRAFCEVCLAVELAHTRGVLHRDLKPQNILLGEFGEVYVLDWGVAKLVGDSLDEDLAGVSGECDGVHTEVGAMIGTPAYMSPEQKEGRADIDARTDVFALGIVLGEILAAAPKRDVPPELEVLCAEAKQAERAARPGSARALGDRVQAYLDGDRDLARRTELARACFERATAAHASDDRSLAMREAGRALALDPELRGAAELVTRLMLEPPAVVPPEVTRELDAAARDTFIGQTRAALWGYVGYMLFVPFVIVLAPAGLAAAYTGAALVAAFLAWRLGRSSARPLLAVFLASNVLLIGVLSQLFSPIAFAPTVAVMTAVILSLNPRPLPMPRTTAFLALGGAFAVPWALQEADLLPRTFRFDDTGIHLFGDALLGGPATTAVETIVSGAACMLIAVGVADHIRRRDSAARKALHLQAWQLRQLVA